MSTGNVLDLFNKFDQLNLTKNELVLLEADLLNVICHELENFYMNVGEKGVSEMIETNYINATLNDILNSGEFTLEGLSIYTQIPEEVLYDIAIGKNLSPSLYISQKIIDLHKLIRKDLYNSLRVKFFNLITRVAM